LEGIKFSGSPKEYGAIREIKISVKIIIKYPIKSLKMKYG